MKKILHIVAEAVRGGCESNCAVFIRYAPRCQHTVLVFGAPGPMSVVWSELGSEVIHLEILTLGWTRFGAGLRKAIQRVGADGVISWAGVRVPLQAHFLRPLGAPVLFYAGNPFSGSAKVRLLLAMSRAVFPPPRRAAVIACSSHVARSYEGVPYYRGLPILTLLNPVEAPDHNLHHARPLEADAVVRIGMVARLDPIKDHALLLRSFAVAHQTWPRAELHLAGDGVLRLALEDLARELGISAAVRFHGSVGDVPAFLDRLDLFCYLTTASEGMGSAFAEALARGVPCVANELGVLREVGGDGRDAAAVFVPADPTAVSAAIDRLLRALSERQRLSSAGWQRARETFAPGRIVQGYLKAMEIGP